MVEAKTSEENFFEQGHFGELKKSMSKCGVWPFQYWKDATKFFLPNLFVALILVAATVSFCLENNSCTV